jgi:hypothetical protein
MQAKSNLPDGRLLLYLTMWWKGRARRPRRAAPPADKLLRVAACLSKARLTEDGSPYPPTDQLRRFRRFSFAKPV